MGHIDLTLTTHRQFYQEVGWLASEDSAGVNVNKGWPRKTNSPTAGQAAGQWTIK